MNQQPEALRLADAYEATGLSGHIDAASELRRLYAENEELKEQRDELLEALKLFPGFTDDATIGDSWLWMAGSTIAKIGGAA